MRQTGTETDVHDRLAPARLADFTTDRRMLMLSAMALPIGLAGAVAAWLLLRLIALATNIFWFGRFDFAAADPHNAALGLFAMAVPVAGSLIIGLMARFGSDKIRGHGIPEAIEAILFGESRLSPKVALLKPLSSAISIGSGGPFGAEGPIIMTGGAIGSLFAQCFHLSAAERKALLVAGAASGMTAIFGTPVAAVLLAVEVLLFEWKPRSFVPVVTAVLVALVARPLLIAGGAMFPFAGIGPAAWPGLPLVVVVGVLAGLQAALLSALLYRIEDGFHKLPVHWMWWPAIGAIVVGIGGLVDPRVLGAGYGNVQHLLDGDMVTQAIVLLLIVKALVWLVALGSGTSGGVLAPLLILGGALGCAEGHFLPGAPGFWALLGMAGIMSGSMRAPLTGALFAVELTGRFDALPLALAASGAAYAVAILLLPRSILTEKVVRRGRHILQEYGVDPLDLIPASSIMERNVESLSATMTIDQTRRFFEEEARHRVYPVVDEDQRPLGMASRADVLRWIVEGRDGVATLGEVLSDASLLLARPDDMLSRIADLMMEMGEGRVLIVDPQRRTLIGLITRKALLSARAMHRSGEAERRRFLHGGAADASAGREFAQKA